MKRALVVLMSLALLGVLVVGVVLVIAARRTPAEDPVDSGGEAAFPILAGTNLQFESVSVPGDLSGEYKLIVVAYDTDQQEVVDKWLRPLEELNTRYPQLAGYYVPLLPQDTVDAAAPIMLGMTMAASSDRDRERTVVVFTDVAAFNTLVDVPDVAEVQLFLLDGDNRVQWQGTGAYQPELLAELENTLARLTSATDAG